MVKASLVKLVKVSHRGLSAIHLDSIGSQVHNWLKLHNWWYILVGIIFKVDIIIITVIIDIIIIISMSIIIIH